METDTYLEMLERDVHSWNAFVANQTDPGIDLCGADLSDADLRGVNFRGVNLESADLGGAALCGAELSGAVLADAHLSGADFSDADLSDADLSGANLRGAFLSNAFLRRVNFTGADLYKATLKGATLLDAHFLNSDLADADLQGAVLHGAILHDANLQGADFSGSDITGACILMPDMNTINLESDTLHGAVNTFSNSIGWTVDRVKCEYIFLDTAKQVRYPQKRIFAPREFERKFCPVSTIEYVFENGMNWLDPILMQRVVLELTQENTMTGLTLLSIIQHSEKPKAVFSIYDDGCSKGMLSQIHMYYKSVRRRLEQNDDFLNEILNFTSMQSRI